MGSAIGGVFIGAAAVYVGLRHRPDPEGEPTNTPSADGATLEPSSSGSDRSTSRVAVVRRVERSLVDLMIDEKPAGVGVIVDAEGTLVGAHEVVAKALLGASGSSGITARGFDGRTFAVKTVVTDPDADLALLRLVPSSPEERFDSAPIAVSMELAAGEELVAFGNPEGLPRSVLPAVVSAPARMTVFEDPKLVGIQLDGSSSLGHSPGPMFTFRGEWVGVVRSRNATPEGVPFAVPAERILAFLEAMTEDPAPTSTPEGGQDRGATPRRAQTLADAQELLGLEFDPDATSVVGADGTSRPFGAEGALVTRVRTASPLAPYAPVVEDAWIVELMGREVRSLDDLGPPLARLRTLRQSSESDPMVLLTIRDRFGQVLELPVMVH